MEGKGKGKGKEKRGEDLYLYIETFLGLVGKLRIHILHFFGIIKDLVFLKSIKGFSSYSSMKFLWNSRLLNSNFIGILPK